ncbi:MAG: hypothetical protein ACSHX6_03550 [Akkermansiaceae bacterium]
MTPLSHIIKPLLLSLHLLVILLGNFSLAQDATTPSSDPHTRIIQQSIALMEQQKWQQSLDLLTPLIEQNKTTGLKKHGARFATTYYYKGLCQLKIAQNKQKQNDPKQKLAATQLFLEAIKSFNQCFAVNPPNDNGNTYRVKSLLLRGNAHQSLGKYQLAIDSYKLFLHERSSALDPYHLSEFNINLAICLWKKSTTDQSPEQAQNDTKEAITLIQKALLYTGRNTPSPRAILTALSTLTDIATSTSDDTLIPSTIQRTLTTSPDNLTLTKDTYNTLLPHLSKLILQTAQKNLPLTSLHLTTLIPGIYQHATALDITTLQNPDPKHIQPNQPTQANQAQKNTIAIAIQARAIALQHSPNTTNLQKALTLYTILLETYPDTPNQPENLYNFTRLAAQSGATDIAITRADQFLEKYPTHRLRNPIRIILLNTLYHTQKYQQSLTLAQDITITPSPSDTSIPNLRLTASFIRAASHYYLGHFSTAATLLAQHQATYPPTPDNPYHTDAAYLTAAVQNQLLHWDKSIPLLRNFISHHSHPKLSNFTPFAYYDIAFAQYSQLQPHSSILTLLPFTLDIPFADPFDRQNFTNSQISPSAAILLGNTHLTLGNYDTAVTHYQQAIQLATDNGNTAARDEAYYLIINLLGKPLWDGLTNHRLPETIPYYLQFLTLPNALKSPYHTQILTSAITALEKANPSHPVHHLLQENLFTHNSTPNTPGIETTLETYLYYLRKDKLTTQEILRILNEDIKTTPSAYHQALLIIAQIQTLEHTQQRKPQKQTLTQINQLYQTLINQFRTQDLDNFTILKIANHLSKANQPQQRAEATTYYQSIINSLSTIKKTEAQLGLAIQLTNTPNPTPKQTTQAQQQLSNILENPYTPPAPRATAHYHLIQLLTQAKEQNWPAIETNSLAYLSYPLSIKTHNQEIQQLLALAYDKQNKTDLAISTYTHNWVTTFFSLQHSAPALNRACQLLWERNNPAAPNINEGKSDRQLAYETAYKYIRKTKDHMSQRRDALPATTIKTWETIKQNATKTYHADHTIKTYHGSP